MGAKPIRACCEPVCAAISWLKTVVLYCSSEGVVDHGAQELITAREHKISTADASVLLGILGRLEFQRIQFLESLEGEEEEEEEGSTTLGEIRFADLGASGLERAERLLTTHLAFSLILHDRMVDRGVFPDARAFFGALLSEIERDPVHMEKPKTRRAKVPS